MRPLREQGMAGSPPSAARLSWPTYADVFLLVAVCAVTFFAGVGATALWEPDEPRFAEATRQMLLRSDFVTPWFNGQPRFEKPPLLYWLQVPFFIVLGENETAARLPSVIAGLLAVLATFALVRDLVSPRAGLLAALVLATTFRFVLYARQGLTDVPVTAAITASVWAMSRALSGRSGSGAARLAWGCVGAAILLKGPVGVLAPVIWSGWAWLIGGKPALRRAWPATGVAIAAAVALPWYVAMLIIHGRTFVDVALGYEVVARYLSPEFPGRDRSVFYYWGVWLGDGAPWSLFFIPSLWWGYARRKALREGEVQLMQLAGVWFVCVLLVFSVSQYKLPHYILPAYPALALAIGVFANATIEGRVPGMLWRVPAYLSAAALAACALLIWLLLARAFEMSPQNGAFALPLLFATGAVVVGALASRSARARPDAVGMQPLAMFTALAVTLVVCYGFLGVYVGPRELRRFQPIPALAAVVRTTIDDDEPLAVAGNYGAPGLVFYSRRTVQQLGDRAAIVSFLSAGARRHCVMPELELREVAPLVDRTLRVQSHASVFSVRMKRLLERRPERATRVLVLVTAD